jgi:sugar (pentulose or hexulose) kinase
VRSRADDLWVGLVYDDTRARTQAEAATESGLELWGRLGYQRMQPSWALPKLLWLLENTAIQTGVRLAHQSDYLTAKLAGEPVATDLSSALKTGLWGGKVVVLVSAPRRHQGTPSQRGRTGRGGDRDGRAGSGE